MHGPDLRTFRLPDQGLRPDFSASQKIIGYTVHEGQLYIATGDSPRAELVLVKSPPAHIYLESSTAEVSISRFEARSIGLKAEDFRPITVILAGLAPLQNCSITLNGEAQTKTTDERGRLVVSAGNVVDLQLEGAPLP